MTNRPLVTIITIFLDEERFIQEAIESVLSQTYDSWELLLVDDGSSDGSTSLARSYAARRPDKIRYFEHEGHKNLGMSASRNLAMRNSRGEYVGLLDADDVWLPQKLERQVAILESEPEAGMVYGPTLCWFSWSGKAGDAGRDFATLLPSAAGRIVEPPELLLHCSPLGRFPAPQPCSLLIRSRVVEEVGGFEDEFRGWGEDQVFLVKVHLHTKVYLSADCLQRYRIHEESCVSRVAKSGEEPSAQLTALLWLEEYLGKQGVRDSRVLQALEEALWSFRHPLLNRLSRYPGAVAGGIGVLMRTGRTRLAGIGRLAGPAVTGSIKADPNPVHVSGFRFAVGMTKLSWEAKGTESVEIHLDAADGTLFARAGPAGNKETGSWVTDGMGFFLQDVSDGKPLTANHTLASVRVKLRKPRQTLTDSVFPFVGRLRDRFARIGLVLMYHQVGRINPDPLALSVSPEHFAEHLEVLRDFGQPLSLRDLTASIANGKLPRRPLVVTLDDGYADNLCNAKPLLERRDVPATVFVVTGYIGCSYEFWWTDLERLLLHPGELPDDLRLRLGGKTHRWKLGNRRSYPPQWFHRYRHWRVWDVDPTPRHTMYRDVRSLLQPLQESEQRKVLQEICVWAGSDATARPTHRTVNRSELATLAQGGLIDIGSHTVSHPVLPELATASQRVEIEQSKSHLEELLGHAVTAFAFPYGTSSPETAEIVRRADYQCGCSYYAGVINDSTNPYQLPRFMVEDWGGDEFARRLSSWFSWAELGVRGRPKQTPCPESAR